MKAVPAKGKAGSTKKSADGTSSIDQKEKAVGEDGKKDGAASRATPKKETAKEEKNKHKKFFVKYEYFDGGNHWCRNCNHISSNVYDVFKHLESVQHLQVSCPSPGNYHLNNRS